MNLLNMFSFMDNLCTTLKPVWTIFGYIIFAIKVIVPLLLIVTGMLSFAQAVMKQKEDDIKKAQGVLIQKIIAAVLVYLIITITGVVVGLVTPDDFKWKNCVDCAFSPFKDGCSITGDDDNSNYGDIFE